jgi:hypothetical protein
MTQKRPQIEGLILIILTACYNRHYDVAEALSVDMQRGRSREQPVRSIVGIIVQKWSAS